AKIRQHALIWFEDDAQFALAGAVLANLIKRVRIFRVMKWIESSRWVPWAWWSSLNDLRACVRGWRRAGLLRAELNRLVRS
ncbi:MAG: hypothetical protein WCC36_17530, partial [Gammaproteobacteria bacterium]